LQHNAIASFIYKGRERDSQEEKSLQRLAAGTQKYAVKYEEEKSLGFLMLRNC
jgi:hypothetical protein